MKKKLYIALSIFLFISIIGLFLYFRYYFTYEQKNVVKRQIETVTGQNLTITVFGFDGKIIKRWTGVKKISAAKGTRNYTFFYTRDNKYVQIPDSVWYIAEEN